MEEIREKILYKERCKFCLTQNYYMRKFLDRKRRGFALRLGCGVSGGLNDEDDAEITVHYTSTFDELRTPIYNMSLKYGFYVNDIYKLFIRDKLHKKLILDHYHCIYLKRNNNLLGYILFTTDAKEILVQFVLVERMYRSCGLGSFLLNMVEICVYYLRDMGLVKYKKGVISTFTYSPVMKVILERQNYNKAEKHGIARLQDHDYYFKRFL